MSDDKNKLNLLVPQITGTLETMMLTTTNSQEICFD